MTTLNGLLRRRRTHALIPAGILLAAGLLLLSCGGEDGGQAEASRTDTGVVGGSADNGHRMTGSMERTEGKGHAGSGVDTIYGCECCPDVRASEPGNCPQCNMTLTPIDPETGEMMDHGHTMDPEAGDAGNEMVQAWTCSMHPDVRSDAPGLCPDCNMKLIPVEPEAGEMMDESHMMDPGPGETMDESHALGSPPGEMTDHGLAGGAESGDAGNDAVEEWTCGMHPAIRSEEPGKCPICNMDLIPVTPSDRNALRLEEEALKQVGARRAEVEYLPLIRTVWAVGQVEYDERQVRYVPSRVPGRVEKLHADFVGTEVRKGEPLLEIYSPELITALGEYERARSALGAGEGAGAGDTRRASVEALARSAKTRLELWGLNEMEIDGIVAAGEAISYRIPIRSPISGTVIDKNAFEGKYVKEGENLFTVADLSTVWITADLFEEDLGGVRVGDMVRATSRTYPGEAFEGRVAFIDPYVDRSTRAARMRMELPNPDMRLKPGMYVEVRLEAPVSRAKGVVWTCPMHPEVVSDVPGECPECGMFLNRIEAGLTLAVPEGAVVHAGETALAYVEKEAGTYEARQLVLGEAGALKGVKDETYYPVLEGLMPNETVITDAGFLVHSQARLTGQAASAYGGALDVGTGGHKHGR